MAAVNTQFAVAVHIMGVLGSHPGTETRSAQLAKSVNANPSFVRRVLSKLSKAALVRATTGKGGACSLTRKPSEISLLEIYKAVEAPKAFALHSYPVQKACAISCNMKSSMEQVLNRTQTSVETTLKRITLAEVITDLKQV
jgi:Rrf2 family protein